MAGLLAFTVLPVLPLRESPRAALGGRPRAVQLATGWLHRLRRPGMALFIGLICFYKFGDSMVASLVGPFMRDSGLAKETIAIMKGTVGSLTSLLGAAAGGWLAFRFGRRRTLYACGLLQTASLLFYVAAASGFGGIGMFWAGTVAEHLFGSMATVALFTLMMDASDPEHAGTDYTLLSCAIVVAMGLANFAAASVADTAGYRVCFLLGVCLSGAGCLVLVRALDARRGPARLQSAWTAGPGASPVTANSARLAS
jgi:MFS family permease